ncbi:MAG: baseplate J/gp47 family protein [Spirochaetota bacterium]
MPLSLPHLDDRTFADLVSQMQSLIPRYTKTWTNHNPSDPGITILELLAWLTEMILYRLDRIPDRSYLNFLELIGVDVSGALESESLEDLLAEGLKRIQERYRAVTDQDFENLAKQAAPEKVARIKVVSNQNLERTTPTGEGHVSLIVLPAYNYIGLPGEPQERLSGLEKAMKSDSAASLRHDILGYLNPRRLITTGVHVVGPQFTNIHLHIRVREKSGVDIDMLKERIKKRITTFLDPYEGGEDGRGWPFGRDVYRSELYQQIEGMEGVDYVEEMLMDDNSTNSFITVEENNLVCLKNLGINE